MAQGARTNQATHGHEPRTDRSVAAANPARRVPGTEEMALCGASLGIAAATVIGRRRLNPAVLTALQPGSCALLSIVICIAGYTVDTRDYVYDSRCRDVKVRKCDRQIATRSLL